MKWVLDSEFIMKCFPGYLALYSAMISGEQTPSEYTWVLIPFVPFAKVEVTSVPACSSK